MRALLVLANEADGVGSHQGDKLLWLKVTLSKSLDDKAASVCFSSVFDRVCFTGNIGSAHLEDHGRSSAVLDGSVASELDEIGMGEHRSDVVSTLFDFLNLFDGELDLLTCSNSLLVLQHHGSRGPSIIEMFNTERKYMKTYLTSPLDAVRVAS